MKCELRNRQRLTLTQETVFYASSISNIKVSILEYSEFADYFSAVELKSLR